MDQAHQATSFLIRSDLEHNQYSFIIMTNLTQFKVDSEGMNIKTCYEL